MRCWNERSIDLAAVRLADRGFSGLLESILRRSEAIPPDLIPFLAHATQCVRCAELLELLLDAETRERDAAVLDELAASPGGEIETGQIEAGSAAFRPRLHLLPLYRVPVPRRLSGTEEMETEEEGYALAADSADLPTEAGQILGDAWVLTLATEDGRYLVRIIPSESEPGATAVLIRAGRSDASEPGQDESSAPTAHPGGGESDGPAPEFLLRIGGRDYPFDQNGVLALPEFPATDVVLIMRETTRG